MAFTIGLEHVQCTGPVPAGQRVDKDKGIPAVEQIVGQVHTSNAVVAQPNIRAREARRQTPHHLGAESVVTEKDIADAGYQN